VGRDKEINRLWKELFEVLERLKNPQPPQIPNDLFSNLPLTYLAGLPEEEKKREVVINIIKEAINSRRSLVESYYSLDYMCSLSGEAISIIDKLIDKLLEDVKALRKAYGEGYITLKPVRDRKKRKYVYPVYITKERHIYLPKGFTWKLKRVRKLKKLRKTLMGLNVNACREADYMREAIRSNIGPII